MSNIYLDSNENLYNPYEKLIAESFKDMNSKKIFRYPDNEYLNLRKVYAKYAKVNAENIIAGNGSDEMLGLIINKFINKGDVFGTLSLDFSMYDFYVNKNQGVIEKYCIGSSLDIEELNSFIVEKKIKLFMFSNPNNPTGRVIEQDTIECLLIDNPKTYFVVDEAYYEFYGKSMVGKINEFSNIIITRTLSKAFGLASLRVGFLISNKSLVADFIKDKVPYNINRISELLAIEALNNISVIEESLLGIIRGRENLFLEVDTYRDEKLKIYKSYANYIYMQGEKVNGLSKYLADKNIIIRVFNEETIRITIPKENQLKNLIQYVKEYLG
ncbi:MAG: pyridoxal phosphate-dependent aminotransferase [Sarcina sp.]